MVVVKVEIAVMVVVGVVTVVMMVVMVAIVVIWRGWSVSLAEESLEI